MLRLSLYGPFSLTGADGAEIALTSRKAKALLAYLALSPGQGRSREEIMALLWSERGEAQARGSLRQVLSGLRKELGDAAAALKIDVERVALDADQITVAVPGEGELLAGFHLNDPAFEDWLRDERLRNEAVAEQAQTEDSPGSPDIAVLPFDTVPETEENEAFSDGLTEDIVTELSRFTEFVTYSPWSSFHYSEQDRDRSTEQIALDLEVDYIIEGSVRHAGDRMRITAMLFDIETVNHVWVQRYDRDSADVFAVQDEVARDVATAVALRIEGDAFEEARQRPKADRSAMDYVLLGERAQQRDWSAEEARRLYEAALTMDPGCARAAANLANWHAESGHTLFVPFEEAHARTRDFGEQALQHAPGDALVLALLADAYANVGEFDLSRQCLDKALKANPNHHGVMGFAASALPTLGDIAGAQDWLERYLRHDPLWQSAAMELSFEVYFMAGRYEEALAAIARMSELPVYLLPLAAAAQAQCGRMQEAKELRERYEAALPEGQSFETHIVAPLRLCLRPELTEPCLDALRKAGFAI